LATPATSLTVRVGLTLGDPCGIGPEIIAAALAQVPSGVAIELFGDRGVFAAGLPSAARLCEVTALAPADRQPGRPTARSARAQVEYLEAAVAAVKRGELDALVTAPIHKAGAVAAGFAFPGHTEFLAHALAAAHPVMLLAGPRLRVALATVHMALRDVAARLSVDELARTLMTTAAALVQDFGIAPPRVALAALNPHAGEGGAFGDEEARLLGPALARARAELARLGIAAALYGPCVPDAVFRDAVEGRYDAVVALYHDQGLIPVKLCDFEEAVNVTLGLPIVRTSPDHGVAYDIAGTGRARPTSMVRALALACELAKRRAAKPG
jgi:4-hydroxythreonine-4-phosphate dehydrogenase